MILTLATVFVAAILTQNIAFTYLLGMCPFVSLSKSLRPWRRADKGWEASVRG